MINVFIPNNPLLSPNKDGTWTLMADWRVLVDGQYYTIPQGFTTDGASIPRFLWRLCGHPMEAPRLYLAIIHDWFYSGGCPGVTRRYADAVFRDGQICVGVRKTHAYVEWLALRLCGRSHWNENTRKGKIMKNITLAIACAAMAFAFSGCQNQRLVDAEAKGMYVNAATETLAIGSGSITTIPGDREASVGHYEEDTAWLSPSTKTHKFDVFLVGSNSTSHVSKIVEAICKAYGTVAPTISSNETAKSGITVFDLFKAKKAASLEKIWNKLTPAAQAEISKLVESGESGVVKATTTDGVQTQTEVKCENGECEVCTDCQAPAVQ